MRGGDYIIRIPIGARLRMRGGDYFVSSGGGRSIVVTGPVRNLRVGESLMLFGHLAEITMREVKTARITLQTKGKFNTDPIYLLAPEEPTEPAAPTAT